MQFNNTPNRCIQVEGEEIWMSRSVTVLPVLIVLQGRRGYVPLGLRGEALPDESGKWGLPGGYLDYDETAGEAVIREVWEELGLNLRALEASHVRHGSLEQPHEVFSQPVRRQNVTLRFPLMFVGDQADPLPPLHPQVDIGEVVEARWFGLNEALNMSLAFNHQEILRHYLMDYFQGLDLPIAISELLQTRCQ